MCRFQNEMCLTTQHNNGTCYTPQDCVDRGGSPRGPCASGFGVCCYFEYMCSRHTSENGTYFINPATPQSMCHLMITRFIIVFILSNLFLRLNNDICQIRLELDVFEIAGPNQKVPRFFQTFFSSPSKLLISLL